LQPLRNLYAGYSKKVMNIAKQQGFGTSLKRKMAEK